MATGSSMRSAPSVTGSTDVSSTSSTWRGVSPVRRSIPRSPVSISRSSASLTADAAPGSPSWLVGMRPARPSIAPLGGARFSKTEPGMRSSGSLNSRTVGKGAARAGAKLRWARPIDRPWREKRRCSPTSFVRATVGPAASSKPVASSALSSPRAGSSLFYRKRVLRFARDAPATAWHRRRSSPDQAFFTAIRLTFACASGVCGSLIVSTPFLKLASAFSPSTPGGSGIVR